MGTGMRKRTITHDWSGLLPFAFNIVALLAASTTTAWQAENSAAINEFGNREEQPDKQLLFLLAVRLCTSTLRR